MGCVNSNEVADQPNQKKSQVQKKTIKSNISIKSKTSIKSNFSRKRTKRTKKSNKIIITPQNLSIQGSRQNISIIISKQKPKKSNVKLRQLHKRLLVDDIIQLNNILTQHFFFFKLKKQQRVSLIEQLKLFQVRKGKHVYQKNNKPQMLFIVKEGLLQIQTQNQNHSKRFLHKNDCFGQIDLIFQFQRSQAVISRQTSKLWALQKWKLDQIKQSIIYQHSNLTKTYLQKVSTLSCLSSQQVQLISKQMLTFRYRTNQNIFLKGDQSNILYIVISGQVQLQIPNKNNLIIKAGQLFGQGCLKAEPQPRIGTATSYNQCRCMVISRDKFIESLGGNNIENIAHFSIIKWAFKRSLQFKDQHNTNIYKKIQKGKIQFFFDRQNILQNYQTNIHYYIISLEGQINQLGVGVLINCNENNQCKNYIKYGDGHVFVLEIKKPKNYGKSLKMVKFQEKKQCDLRTPLTHIYKQEDFKYNNLESFLQNLLLIKRLKTLESGKGDVYNVLNKVDGKFYNIRCIKKIDISEKGNVETLINEKNIMMKAKMCTFLSHAYKTFYDDHHIYFILKYYQNGDLQSLLQKHKIFSLQIMVHLIACIIVGLQFIHTKMNTVHRNIALENIFLNDDGYFGIDNFQNAKQLQLKKPKTHTILGTPHYFAPQMIQGKGYSFQVDYWALGVVIYRIIYGRFPFTNLTKDPFDIFKHIIKNNIEFKMINKLSPALIQLTRLLLSSDPKSRLTQNSLRNHELFIEIDWQQFEKKNISPPFNIQMFGIKKIDKKFYQQGKNFFSNFISKQKKRLDQTSIQKIANFKTWDSHFS